MIISSGKSSAEATIKSASDELVSLTALFNDNGKFVFTGSSTVPLPLCTRVDSLLSILQAAQDKAMKLTKEGDDLKKVLKEDGIVAS